MFSNYVREVYMRSLKTPAVSNVGISHPLGSALLEFQVNRCSVALGPQKFCLHNFDIVVL